MAPGGSSDIGSFRVCDATFLNIPGNLESPAVRIGELANNGRYDGFPSVDQPGEGSQFVSFPIESLDDPMTHLFEKPGAASNGISGFESKIFPVLMYRFQVKTASDERVSGDIIQTNPLMEQIAYNLDFDPGIPANVTYIRDPYVASIAYALTDQVQIDPNLIDNTVGGSKDIAHGLYLLDSQPVIRGATYQYLLVRFKENKEIDCVINCGTVTIP